MSERPTFCSPEKPRHVSVHDLESAFNALPKDAQRYVDIELAITTLPESEKKSQDLRAQALLLGGKDGDIEYEGIIHNRESLKAMCSFFAMRYSFLQQPQHKGGNV